MRQRAAQDAQADLDQQQPTSGCVKLAMLLSGRILFSRSRCCLLARVARCPLRLQTWMLSRCAIYRLALPRTLGPFYVRATRFLASLE